MRCQLVILASAEADLRALRSYLVANFGKRSWQDSYRKIKAAMTTIRTYPLRGVVPVELTDMHLTQFRQVLAGLNRIIYEVRGTVIYVHVICDTRKDLPSLLMQRLVRSV
ncbi:MAG: type II toxin-antitoxin system RelE/ParE family toxin [Pseudomonadota bacterium]